MKKIDGRSIRDPMTRYHTHGKTNTPEWYSWQHMKGRCNNSKNKDYQYYGGRGIKVCKRWAKFSNFFSDMGERPSIKHSLDRIDVNGNYSPKNCRWATKNEQSRNTRANRWFLYQGKKYLAIDLAKKFGICERTMISRLFLYKMTVEEAISQGKFPRRKRRSLVL